MNLVARAKNILISPAKEWGVIKEEELSVMDMFTKYAVLLAAIPAVCGLIGYTMFGISYGFGSFTVPFGIGLTFAIATYVLSLIGVFILSVIVDALAPSFGSTKNMAASMKVVVFSYTASWVAGVFSIIPALGIIAELAGIYTLVLLWMGLKQIKEVPQEKMLGYFIVILIVAIVVYVVIGAIVTAVAFGSLITGAIRF